MTDTTTIEITQSQKDWLDDFKASGQSYKGALDELIETYGQHEFEAMGSYNDGIEDVIDVSQADIDRVINRIDDLENTLPRKITEELQR